MDEKLIWFLNNIDTSTLLLIAMASMGLLLFTIYNC